jgi:hypothetical protein
VAEQVTGVRGLAVSGDERSTLRFEIADAELYGIDGLRSSGARVACRHKSLVFGGWLVNIASPVGDHARAIVEAGFHLGDSWHGIVRGGVERLALIENDPLTWRVAGVESRTEVGRVSTIADVEVIRGHDTYETSMRLAAGVHAGIAELIGTVRIDGDRFAGAGVSTIARVHTNLALLAGYDDGAESLRGGAVVTWRPVEIAIGVYQHPVLGLSQGVSVAWVR